jgi:ankyrin repeat protein
MLSFSPNNPKPLTPAEETAIQRQQKRELEEFYRCCAIGNIEGVKVLINKQIDLNATDTLGNTPLMKAVRFGQFEIVKLLLAHKVKVNEKNSSGWTALKYALYTGRQDIADLLWQADAIEY